VAFVGLGNFVVENAKRRVRRRFSPGLRNREKIT
jgi:hypothetical protein